MDLAEFVSARLDEDEAAAKACESPSPWRVSDHPSASSVVDDAAGEPLIYNEGSPSEAEAAHIARHDPARVLREVEAKRKIVSYAENTFRVIADNDLHESTSIAHIASGLGAVLGDLATVWSDHPDYPKVTAVLPSGYNPPPGLAPD